LPYAKLIADYNGHPGKKRSSIPASKGTFGMGDGGCGFGGRRKVSSPEVLSVCGSVTFGPSKEK